MTLPFKHIGQFAAILVCLLLCPVSGQAQRVFHQDDWIAWGDARSFNDFAVSQNEILIATDAGILRLDRIDKVWLTPWFSVPGPGGTAIFLQNASFVREDPMTRNLYVRLSKGAWYRKYPTSEIWDRLDSPDPGVVERLLRSPGGTPTSAKNGLVVEHPYYIGAEGELTRSWASWKPSGGITDDRGLTIYCWDGFGLGVTDSYSYDVDLYPAGPGPVHSMGITETTIWTVSTLDRASGWAWKRDRFSDRWDVFLPDLEFGLEPASVNRLRLGENGEVWLATDAGVFIRKQESWYQIRKRRGLPRNEVLDIAPVKDGAWVATKFGLARISSETLDATRPDRELEPLPGTGFFNLIAAYKDTLIAAGPGLLLKRVREGRWEEIDFPPITGRGTPLSALYFDKEQLALGDRHGFAWRDSRGNWQELSNTLWRGGSVLALEYHEGLWWLGTDVGLVSVDPQTKKATLFTSREGLPGNEVYDIKGEGDWLWLGTDVALVRFYWNSPGRVD